MSDNELADWVDTFASDRMEWFDEDDPDYGLLRETERLHKMAARLRELSAEVADWKLGSDVEAAEADAARKEVGNLQRRLQACQSNDDSPLTDDTITQNERILLAENERLRDVVAAMDGEVANCHAEILRLTRLVVS